MTARPVVVLGYGGHARVVADICRAAGRAVQGFLDRQGGRAGVIGDDALLDDPVFVANHEFIIGIADQRIRPRLAELVGTKGGVLASVIHPSAVVAPDVRIGAGVVVAAGCVVNPGAVLGDLVIVNTAATVDHDCVLAEGVHVCPGAHLTGGVTCGAYATIGTGAIVIPGRVIGSRAVIGPGAVVLSDVKRDVTVYGNPARAMSLNLPKAD